MDGKTNINDKVTIVHKAVVGLSERRELFAAIRGGTYAMRQKREVYLPKYPAETPSDYEARLRSSTVDGIVSGGIDTLCGSVFAGEIDTSRVTIDQDILENFDNCGNHFNNFSRDAFDAAFDGCAVIFVDMPAATPESEQAAKTYGAEADRSLNKRPYAVLYRASDVTNWRYEKNAVTGKQELVMLVVKIKTDVPDGDFAVKETTSYRVWRKVGDAVRWELWTQSADNSQEFIQKVGIMGGISRIPAAVIGELDDEPRLMSEASLELKAYQKESSFDAIEYLSVPLLALIGRDQAATDKPLLYGPSTFVDIPVGGDAKFVGIDSAGHDSLKGTIREIKDFIKSRLNYIVSSAAPAGDTTATEAMIEDQDKQARLVRWADDLKDKLELVLSYMAEFQGKGLDGGGEIVLNTKWAMAEAARQEMMERDATIVTEGEDDDNRG